MSRKAEWIVKYWLWLGVAGLLAAAVWMFSASALEANHRLPNLMALSTPHGKVETFSDTGYIDLASPFFEELGTNGRSCGSCHIPENGWSISAASVRERFREAGCDDPLFHPVDGSNSPESDECSAENYSLLLEKGLIRVGIPMPANAEFRLVDMDDPYKHSGEKELSMFRRPLPSTNLRFLSAVMWDGRASHNPLLPGKPLDQNAKSLNTDLQQQTLDAIVGHSQAKLPTKFKDLSPKMKAKIQEIVDFEMGLSTAQIRDDKAGRLNARGADGGAKNLSEEEFYIGINDPLGENPTGEDFDPEAFTLFEEWGKKDYFSFFRHHFGNDSRKKARQSIARGEEIFNTRKFGITDVSGLNDALGVKEIEGTCTTCHDSPNVGNHSVPLPLDIGVGDPNNPATMAALDLEGLPVYTFKCVSGPLAGQTFTTTDPGRALITGKCADFGRMKGPILRALDSRAPYFHNGAASSLKDVVEFYNIRFDMGLTRQEKADLVAFLQAS